MLRQRFFTAFVGLPLLLLIMSFGYWGMVVLSSLLAGLIAGEAARLVPSAFNALNPARPAYDHGATHAGAAVEAPSASALSWALAAVAVMFGFAFASRALPAAWAGFFAAGVIVALIIAFAALVLLRDIPRGNGVAGATLVLTMQALLCGVFVVWPLSLWPLLWDMGNSDRAATGYALAALPLLAAWGSDLSAYFAGRFFGKTPLLPGVSPKKTREGAIAGLAGGCVFSMVAAPWLPWPIGTTMALGVCLAAVGQLGDLWESALKRVAGVKDSGAWLPGHGGMFDRFDALLFTLPFTYFFAVFY